VTSDIVIRLFPSKLLWTALALLAVLPVSFARAQATCRSPMTQSELTRCAWAGALAAQRRLDSLLVALDRSLDSTRARDLRAIQLDWVKARDGYCRWDAGSYEGGSVQPMWLADCLAGQTRARIDDLRTHLCGDDAGMAGTCAAAEHYGAARKARSRR
jgi:uncharacterized protein YecT (DUF1311 family)